MEDQAPSRPQATPGKPGGTIEPNNRVAVARELYQKPEELPARRYEMADPLADLTYRAKTFDEMALKADQLGSTRFHVIDPDGRRNVVNKVDGRWMPPPAREHAPDAQRSAPAATPSPARTTSPPAQASRPDPEAMQTTTPSPKVSSLSAVAAIEAQAQRAAYVNELATALQERYVIKRQLSVGDLSLTKTEYRFRADTQKVAFTESTFKLATDNNNPAVARSMVDVAESRNWQALRVSGNEEFKRLVWLEANLRGVKAIGYDATRADRELLQREQDKRQINRIEPQHPDKVFNANIPSASGKQSARGSSGRKVVLAALEAVLVAKAVPPKQREAVMAAAEQNLAQRIRNGQIHKVKVFDPAAPSQRTPVVPTPELQRSRDRAAPVR
jgi:hypothetical protein